MQVLTSLLCLRERSYRVMRQNSSCRVCIWDTNLPPPPQKNSSRANDVISMFVHALSFDCYAILRTFEWTVADKLFILSLKSVIMTFKSLADMSSRNMHEFYYEQKAVVCRLRVVYPLLLNREKCSFTSLA